MAFPASGSRQGAAAGDPLTLVPFAFWLPISDRAPSAAAAAQPQSSGDRAASLAALQQAMAEHLAALGHPGAEPLRWAITGADPLRGLRLEGIGLSGTHPADAPSQAAAQTAGSRQPRAGLTSATDPA